MKNQVDTNIIPLKNLCILRIEHPSNGLGPFSQTKQIHPEFSILNLLKNDRLEMGKKLKSPQELTGAIGSFFQNNSLLDTRHYFFGIDACCNISTLIHKDMALFLDRSGFEILTYIAPHKTYYIEDEQVAFIKENASCIGVSTVINALQKDQNTQNPFYLAA